MKVLFAVSSESISEQIIKRYQKEYKEILTYKNVYYFNAILKEIQKDKSYDRIVISEDLEPFSTNNYSTIDKFIFEKLDSISDEAQDKEGNETNIILICADRRTKNSSLLVKLFSIGIYNALIENDRNIEKVCSLIKRPRSKKEAKAYYKIDSEDATYKSEKENEVSEIEIQNILNYFKKISKSPEKFSDGFNNIASQYTDMQLRIIINCLPIKVKSVLEKESPKYRELMKNKLIYTKAEETVSLGNKETSGIKINSIENKSAPRINKPIVIPSAIKKSEKRKVVVTSSNSNNKENRNIVKIQKDKENTLKSNTLNVQKNEKSISQTIEKNVQPVKNLNIENAEIIKNEKSQVEQLIKPEIQQKEVKSLDIEKEKINNEEVVEVVKKGRGRPRKYPVSTEVKPKGKRGRPRKLLPELEEKENEIPEDEKITNIINNSIEVDDEEIILPSFDDEEDEIELPTFEDEEDDEVELPTFEDEEDDEIDLPTFEEEDDDDETILPIFEEEDDNIILNDNYGEDSIALENENKEVPSIKPSVDYSMTTLNSLMTKDKKIVTFLGTSKNGTSFLVNNLAAIFDSMGINTAILDMTKNKNSYYIYTNNEESLRKTAYKSITNLKNGYAEGIKVGKNLTVYTALPNDGNDYSNAESILSTLVQNHSLVLIDCDFTTDPSYFASCQEIYLVQSMDILTIQPLTMFLRDLKTKGVLDSEKIRVVVNKELKMRSLTSKMVIAGLSFYNDPAMSFMTDLFNKDLVKACTIPYDENAYSKYLDGMVNCKVSISGYSKNFISKLKVLAEMVYPRVPQSTYEPNRKTTNFGNNKFSANMNNTLEQMRKKY